MFSRILVLAAFLVVLPKSEAYADTATQTDLSGGISGIISYKDSSIIIGATVRAFNENDSLFGDMTDALGCYEITGLPPGTYTVIANMVCMNQDTVTNILVGDENVSLDFYLHSVSVGFTSPRIDTVLTAEILHTEWVYVFYQSAHYHRYTVQAFPEVIDVDCHGHPGDLRLVDISSEYNLDNDSLVSGGLKLCQIHYVSEGRFISEVIRFKGFPCEADIDWVSSVTGEPRSDECTSVSLRLRSSFDPRDMGEWSEEIHSPVDIMSYLNGFPRFIQYEVILRTDIPTCSPVLEELTIKYSYQDSVYVPSTRIIMH